MRSMQNRRGKKNENRKYVREKGFAENVENLIEHAKRISHPVSGEEN